LHDIASTMHEKINKLLSEVESFNADTLKELEEYRIKWLSKKGEITALFEDFRSVPNEMKKEVGQRLNELKTKAEEIIKNLKILTIIMQRHN
jgi:phenylalanyl-tRNA synthetase alpha chain